MLECFKCGLPAFTVRGLCRKCGPEIHEQWCRLKAEWYREFRAFKFATGKEPLDDWCAFEAFIDAKV